MCTAGASYFVNESDIVICSDDATFFDSHVTGGMVSALEPVGLMRRIGLGETLRIALTGNDERVTADTAMRIGLVTEVVAHEQLLDRAKEIAAIVNRNAPLAVRGTRLAIRKGLDLPLHEAEILAEAFRERVVRTDDAKEGPRAFVEKRPPDWTAR
jgi:enoyl-CoA hydratase/carnithine racemase